MNRKLKPAEKANLPIIIHNTFGEVAHLSQRKKSEAIVTCVRNSWNALANRK